MWLRSISRSTRFRFAFAAATSAGERPSLNSSSDSPSEAEAAEQAARRTTADARKKALFMGESSDEHDVCLSPTRLRSRSFDGFHEPRSGGGPLRAGSPRIHVAVVVARALARHGGARDEVGRYAS